MLKVKKNKQTNKQTDGQKRQQRCRKRTLSQWSASFGEPRDGSCVCGVCVHHEFTIFHIILPLFTRGHQRSDWSSPLFQVLGGWGQAPLSPPVSRRPHKHYSVGRKAGNKSTHCSPITRHQVVTWPRRLKQHTHTHRHAWSHTHPSTHTHTRSLYSIQCTSPIHTKLRPLKITR